MSSSWFADGSTPPEIAQTGGIAFCGLNAGPAKTTIALNSSYVYGASGAAVMAMFVPRDSANLTDLWIRVDSYTGTWASATDQLIDFQIREGVNGTGIPGTTLTGSGTIDLAGAPTGWVKTTGLSIALTAGKQYCIVLGDANGGAVNYVNIVRDYGAAPIGINGVAALAQMARSQIRTTTTGFASAGTGVSMYLTCIFKIGSIYYGGNGIDTRVTITSGTYARGLKITVPGPCTIVGAVWSSDGYSQHSGDSIKLFDSSTGPSGTALKTWTIPTLTTGGGTSPFGESLGFAAADRYDLAKGTYRFVIVPSTNRTLPRKATIASSPDAEVKIACLGFGGLAFWTEDTASAWVDSDDSIPEFGPVLAPTDTAIHIIGG